MTNQSPPAQASDEPMRAAFELTKEVVDSVQRMTGAPDVRDIPHPYAGAIVLLETFASIGMTARRDGQPTPNSLLCTKFANDLRLAAAPRATADVERDAARYRWLRDQPWVDCEATFRLDLPENAFGKHYNDALAEAIDARIAATKGAKP